MLIASANLSDIPNISHGFFTNQGGVSSGIYASLNTGLGSSDARDNVIKNRDIIAKNIGVLPQNLMSLYQVHSADVINVEKRWRFSKLPKADAMVTNQKDIALAILTADCVPVLFADAEKGVIGAAHAGWKGAYSGVIQNTVAEMRKLGAENIVAAIGPAIEQKSYEVDAKFRDNFLAANSSFVNYFINSNKPNHFLFDIKGFVKQTIVGSGVENICVLPNDTYSEAQFFSYRRTTHRGETDYGRQMSVIVLR